MKLPLVYSGINPLTTGERSRMFSLQYLGTLSIHSSRGMSYGEKKKSKKLLEYP